MRPNSTMILNYQYDRHSHDESEDFGVVSASEALAAFELFVAGNYNSLRSLYERA